MGNFESKWLWMDYIRKSKMGPTILEVNLQFRKELRNQDQIVIRSKLLSYEGKVANFEQENY